MVIPFILDTINIARKETRVILQGIILLLKSSIDVLSQRQNIPSNDHSTYTAS